MKIKNWYKKITEYLVVQLREYFEKQDSKKQL